VDAEFKIIIILVGNTTVNSVTLICDKYQKERKPNLSNKVGYPGDKIVLIFASK